ncbi:MAG: hypothetical protein QM734_00870 [Cyclobacteriaceae bacterium]
MKLKRHYFLLQRIPRGLLYAGAYFAPAANQDDKAIDYINQYIAGGGKNVDAQLQLYYTYFKRKDWDFF